MRMDLRCLISLSLLKWDWGEIRVRLSNSIKGLTRWPISDYLGWVGGLNGNWLRKFLYTFEGILFTQWVIDVWNKLPGHVVEAETLGFFKAWYWGDFFERLTVCSGGSCITPGGFRFNGNSMCWPLTLWGVMANSGKLVTVPCFDICVILINFIYSDLKVFHNFVFSSNSMLFQLQQYGDSE